jgi:hypothetical protein
MKERKRIGIVAENPMLKFGVCSVAETICKKCKHLIGDVGNRPEPKCQLRGKKPHDPEWPACAKFLTWKEWKAQRDAKALPPGPKEKANIGYFGEGGGL